jgi:opacity protein-like surface antigen
MKTNRNHALIALFALSSSTLAGTSDSLESAVTTPAAAADAWEFRVGLPLWASGLDGDTGVLGLSNPVDVGFDDILSHLDMAAALSFEARKGRLGFISSFIYMNISDAADTPGPLFDSVSLDIKQLVVDAAVSYAVVDDPGFRVEALLGARYNSIDIDFKARSTQGDRSASSENDWVDPYIGFQTRTRLNESLDLIVKGDIGGFDVGSELTWQAYAGLEYQFSNSIYGALGYRAISVDYSSGGFTYDMLTSGPQLEFGMKF